MSIYNKNFNIDNSEIEDLEVEDLDYGIEFLADDKYEREDVIHFDDSEEENIDVALDDNVDYVNIHHENTKKPTILSELISYAKIFIVAFIIAFVFTRFVIINAKVPTGSMKNTIMEDDKLVGFRLAYIFNEPKHGDIIIFKNPLDESENFVKRVIGVPGDVVQIISGSVYVNGELLEEDYILEPMAVTSENSVYIVPDDCYFVMGDNRNDSHDSRYWQKNGVPSPYVHKNQILAKALFRYYNGETKKLFDFKAL